MQTTQRNLIEMISLFLCSLFLFTWGLSSQEIIGFDSRFYLFAEEMWRYGVNWFPTTYQAPYPDYPAASTFLIYLVASLLGGVNKFSAVLPSAIAAAITLTLTYRIGALHNKRWGICAVFFMLLTITFLKSARSIALDMYPTLITTCCFYLIYSADIEHKPRRALWIYLWLCCGFAFRGPIGLVVPTGVICTYYLLSGSGKRFFLVGCSAFFLLIICSVLLLALAYHVGGNSFMHDVLRMEVLGRMDSSYLPRYFYFVDGMGDYALSFPLAGLVMLGVGYYAITTQKLSSEFKFLLQLCGWMSVILIGMSIPGDKKIRYILPMLPAAALIAAYPFAVQKEKYFIYLRWIGLRVFALFPLIFIMLISAVYVYANKHTLNFNIPYARIILFLLSMQMLNLLIIFCVNLRDIFILLIAALSFAVAYIAVMERIELSLDRARDFVQQVESERLRSHARLVFYKEKPDSLPIKYLINMPYFEQPMFVTDQQSLIALREPTLFVTSASYFDELPKEIANQFRIVVKNKLGHVAVVAFARKQRSD